MEISWNFVSQKKWEPCLKDPTAFLLMYLTGGCLINFEMTFIRPKLHELTDLSG